MFEMMAHEHDPTSQAPNANGAPVMMAQSSQNQRGWVSGLRLLATVLPPQSTDRQSTKEKRAQGQREGAAHRTSYCGSERKKHRGASVHVKGVHAQAYEHRDPRAPTQTQTDWTLCNVPRGGPGSTAPARGVAPQRTKRPPRAATRVCIQFPSLIITTR
jgi:hypothetical protein